MEQIIMKQVLKVIIFSGLVGALLVTGCANDSAKDDEMADKTNLESQQTVTPQESRPLSEISGESELKKQDCDDEYKNEQGVCEVPNPEYPKELIDKKYKQDEQEKDSEEGKESDQ